jgi:hypothetical protein
MDVGSHADFLDVQQLHGAGDAASQSVLRPASWS